MRLTAVVVARNEEATIADVVRAAARVVSDVVVLDGHSTDRTRALAAEAGARVILDPGRGKGSAIRWSLAHLDADVLVFIDADGSHDPADIPKLAAPVLTGEADLCIGSRFSGGSDELSLSVSQLVRSIGNILMNIAINRRWKVALTDTLNGFRAVRRQAALEAGLTEDRHTIEQEMVMKLLARGATVINVPAHEYARRAGTSHIDIRREWPAFVWCVIANLVRASPAAPAFPARAAAVLGGVLLVLAALAWLVAWRPLPPAVPPPSALGTVTVIRLALIAAGLAFLVPWLRGWRFRPLAPAERPAWPAPPAGGGLGFGATAWALAATTVLAALLRVVHLDSSLWLDEISTLLIYQGAPASRVLGGYNSNNHLLNTLLVKLAAARLGEAEWVVRLPAVLFGTATVPAVFWVARQALGRPASLAAALLLAVSSHHVFFSQNARGYSAYLLFSLLASGLLVKALREDRLAAWTLYVAAAVLDMASVPIASFVLGAHAVVAAAVLAAQAARGRPVLPLARRLGCAGGAIGLLVLALYSPVLQQMLAYARLVYTDPAAGFAPFSRDFAAEVARGLAAGAGPLFAVPALAGALVAMIGAGTLLRRQWPLALALALPAALQVAALAVRGLVVSPRFFLLMLAVALLAVAAGLETLTAAAARALGRQRPAALLGASALAVGALALALPLRAYYAAPKQDYRGAIRFVESERRPDGFVIILHLAEAGYRYYGPRLGVDLTRGHAFVRSMPALEAALAGAAERPRLLVTTFPRALRLTHPDLASRLSREWVVVRTFPGTVGDGDIVVWRPRQTRARSG